MPAQDLADFAEYWNLSMFNSDGTEKQPGGNPDNGGVDYSEYLIPWCKGNSVSVDQSTLRQPRDLISMLVENYRASLQTKDSGESKRLDHRCGVTLDELKRMFGKPFTRRSRKYSAGDVSVEWIRVERILQAMLVDGDIALFSGDNTLHPRMNDIKENIRRRGRFAEQKGELDVCNALENFERTFGHVRMSRKKGWELYIRDHYGSPEGVEGVIPGNMSGFTPTGSAKTMPYPLHLVYAETLARAESPVRGEWGKNQSKIRREMSDSAIDGNGSSIPLDEYYIIFSRNNAAHMADYFLQRSIGDMAAARCELIEVHGSDPKSWEVRLDPDLVRWRENRRQRDRERQ